MSTPTADRAPAWRAAECAARESYGKLLALLVVRSGDVALAEDALADAFAIALERWPATGVPQSPDAWLLTAARRRLIDETRHRRTGDRVGEAIARQTMQEQELAMCEPEVGSEISDHRLALMFACTHPAIDRTVRAPLILQVVLGFEAERIATAFVQSPAAMAQRLVRAKRKIRDAKISIQIPDGIDRPERLEAVLDAIYVAYADGWADPLGASGHGESMADEAIRLGRLVVALADREPEPFGLLALMLFAESRRNARRTSGGGYVPLSEQDTSVWNGAMINEAEQLLLRASGMGRIGRFQLEAAVQSVHAARRQTGSTDWPAIVLLYDALLAVTRSMVVATNRAVAVAMVHGPAVGLAVLREIEDDPRLDAYQPYWAARAELHARAGERAAARVAYERAMGLTADPAMRSYLAERRDASAS